MVTLKTIDAHAEGGPLRLVVEGFPSPRGRAMTEKVEWVRRHADGLRRLLLREPRGHAGVRGAVLTEAVMPGSHAGVIFMSGDGYASMSGHGIIAVTTIALERGLVMPGGEGFGITFDTAAGTVRAEAMGTPERISRVAFVNVPSFVVQGGLPLRAVGRQIRVDVAFGGAFYAIVDSESVGLSIDAQHVPELRRAGIEIARSADALQTWAHPNDDRLSGISATVFTAPPRHERSDLRNVTVSADGQVDRSPGGTATAAVMAVLDAMGLLADDRPFVHEGIVETRLSGRLLRRTTVGASEAIICEISGSAWITGEHTFLAAADDPFREGLPD
jgi:proline racemase